MDCTLFSTGTFGILSGRSLVFLLAPLLGLNLVPFAGGLGALAEELAAHHTATGGDFQVWVARPEAPLPGEIPEPILARERERIEVVRRVTPCVVAIFSFSGQSGGSGVLISPDGYALTNFHVAAPCGIALKCGLPDGNLYDAITVGWDPVGDVALIKLVGREEFPFAVLGDSDAVQVGDEVFVMGNPFMLATDLQPTVTHGIISGVHRYQHPAETILEYTDCLQTDASINPGNSGGPMFDKAGRLIGINGRASFDRRGRINVGVGYAIPINQIKRFLGHLLAGRIVDHASLGFRVGSDVQGAPVVTSILEGSDAFRRGLRLDDEIVRFADRPILEPNDLKNLLGTFPPGWQVPLVYRRGEVESEIMVRLLPLHAEAELLEKMERIFTDLALPPDRPPSDDPARLTGPQDPLALPSPVRPYYEPRHGFANFYFNRLRQTQILHAWELREKLQNNSGDWVLEGRLSSGESFRLQIGDRGSRLRLAGSEVVWNSSRPTAAEELAPSEPRGLLLSMYLWRCLAVKGSSDFPDLYCWGQQPYLGWGPMVDVLAAGFGVCECRWFFHSGLLLGLEVEYDPHQDPWEVRFASFDSIGELVVPRQISVWIGTQLVADFLVDKFLTDNSRE
jgi:serine protease Do